MGWMMERGFARTGMTVEELHGGAWMWHYEFPFVRSNISYEEGPEGEFLRYGRR
jgi:hypothetical protein